MIATAGNGARRASGMAQCRNVRSKSAIRASRSKTGRNFQYIKPSTLATEESSTSRNAISPGLGSTGNGEPHSSIRILTLNCLDSPARVRHPVPVMIKDIANGMQIRRAADLLIVAFLLLITLPLILMVAVAIKLESPGPILVRRRLYRIGADQIGALKFRTLRSHTSDRTSGESVLSRVGWFLHLVRIEDLPQLLNVLRGELTLFGPVSLRPDFLRP